VKAQVTVGSEQRPNVGALLDLKQRIDNDANADKGLNFPRVALLNPDRLEPCATTNPTNNATHRGLVVYHTGNAVMSEGMYYWDGNTWLRLVTQENNNDSREISWISVNCDVQGLDELRQSVNFDPDTANPVALGNSTISLTVPMRYDANNRVVLQWSVWGDSRSMDENHYPAYGSIRYHIFVERHDGVRYRPYAAYPKGILRSVYMNSFYLIEKTQSRWNAVPSPVIRDLPEGSYRFTLMYNIEDLYKMKTTYDENRNYINFWGITAKGDVMVNRAL